METLLEGIGNFLTPGKVDSSDQNHVSNGAQNGDVKSSNQDKSGVIPSAEHSSIDGAQNGAKHKPSKKAKQNKLQIDSKDPTYEGDSCGMCKNSILKCTPKGFVQCWFCEVNFCLGCTNFTAHMQKNVLDRTDVLWTCISCMPRVENAKLAVPMGEGGHVIPDNPFSDGNAILEKFSSLQGEIDGLKSKVDSAVTGMSKLSTDLGTQMRVVMNETLFGDEYPEFDPTISHKQAKKLANEQNKAPPQHLAQSYNLLPLNKRW